MAELFPGILSGITPTYFHSLYKAYVEIFSPFYKSSSFQRYQTPFPQQLSKIHSLSHPFLKRSSKTFSKVLEISVHFSSCEFTHTHFLDTPFSSRLVSSAHQFLLPYLRVPVISSQVIQMGRFESLVDSPAKIEVFKQTYHIPKKLACDIVPQNKSLHIERQGKWSFL